MFLTFSQVLTSGHLSISAAKCSLIQWILTKTKSEVFFQVKQVSGSLNLVNSKKMMFCHALKSKDFIFQLSVC